MISLILLIGNSFSAFLFYLAFSDSRSLWENVIYCALEGVIFMGVFLRRLCKSNIFGAWAIFGTDASHVFPQSVLSVTPLTGSVMMLWCPKAALDVQWGVLLALCLSQPFWVPPWQSCTAGLNFLPGPISQRIRAYVPFIPAASSSAYFGQGSIVRRQP